MGFLTRKGIFDGGKVLFLPVEEISPNPDQPRRVFSQPELEELAASIRALGVLQPLTVRRREGQWELVAGERRLRAAKLAGLSQVPCLPVQVDSQSSSLLALVENVQRRDLDFWEEALALRQILDTYHLSQEELARRVGRSQSAVANKLRLLKLPDEALALLRAHGATERHARALLRLDSPERQLEGGGAGCFPGAHRGPDRGPGGAAAGGCPQQPENAHLYSKGCPPVPEHPVPEPGAGALRRGGRPLPPAGHRRGDPPHHPYPPADRLSPPPPRAPARGFFSGVSRETLPRSGPPCFT